MATPITDENLRKLPLRRPEGWVPKMPRWTLRLPDGMQALSVVYIGVQTHDDKDADNENDDENDKQRPRVLAATAATHVINQVEHSLQNSRYRPVIVDRFTVVSGRDISDSRVWACYWTTPEDANDNDNDNDAKHFLTHLNLKAIHDSLDEQSRSVLGLWSESFHPHLTRFETNYSGDDYRPGLAQLADTQQVQHGLTGYWGAARDRIHASAYDGFEEDEAEAEAELEAGGKNPTAQIQVGNETKGHHLRGTNTKTIAHIRSGQFWENCSETERSAYETRLEPSLLAGLRDIEERPEDLGDYGLRFLRNLSSSSSFSSSTSSSSSSSNRPRGETCAAGFFRSLTDLETWAKGCPSHHKIYGGSVDHRRKFGTDGKMRTWHEISVLKPGEADWEYINCWRGTGTLLFQKSQSSLA